jgi:large subunit ribosomal protein L20
VARVKRGVTARRRHKKILNLTKGHRATNHALYRRAHESLLHAMDYAYVHRRERKGDMRRQWNARINAAARMGGLSYSQFIHALRLAGVKIDRKMMADMVVKDWNAFSHLLAVARPTKQGS